MLLTDQETYVLVHTVFKNAQNTFKNKITYIIKYVIVCIHIIYIIFFTHSLTHTHNDLSPRPPTYVSLFFLFY